MFVYLHFYSYFGEWKSHFWSVVNINHAGLALATEIVAQKVQDYVLFYLFMEEQSNYWCMFQFMKTTMRDETHRVIATGTRWRSGECLQVWRAENLNLIMGKSYVPHCLVKHRSGICLQQYSKFQKTNYY